MLSGSGLSSGARLGVISGVQNPVSGVRAALAFESGCWESAESELKQLDANITGVICVA